MHDIATIQALRADLALQLARHVKRRELSQVAAAKWLEIPQPTLSKIMNGRVADLSLELLIRIAVRAGLPVTLQTGRESQEAGAFVSGAHAQDVLDGPARRGTGMRSQVAESARAALLETARRMTLEQRLQAHHEHSELLGALHRAGRDAETARVRNSKKRPR